MYVIWDIRREVHRVLVGSGFEGIPFPRECALRGEMGSGHPQGFVCQCFARLCTKRSSLRYEYVHTTEWGIRFSCQTYTNRTGLISKRLLVFNPRFSLKIIPQLFGGLFGGKS